MSKKEEIENQRTVLLKEIPVLREKIDGIEDCKKYKNEELIDEVLKFLYLVSIANQSISPSRIVDLVWHEFILFTPTYFSFCELYYGKYIHHKPEAKGTTGNRSYLKTLQLYILTFGQPPEHFWGKLATNEWETSQCGSCETI